MEGDTTSPTRSALERSGGVQTRTAEELGISERVLRYKMHKYGLEGRPA
jgi:two-component system response regulator AtoC